MKTLGSVRREIRKAYQKLRNWRAVGRRFGISEGMAWRIANEAEYEPKDAHIRTRLGLPALEMAPACPRCGVVHVTKRCTKRGRTVRRLWDMPVGALRKMLEEREEWK